MFGAHFNFIMVQVIIKINGNKKPETMNYTDKCNF